MSMVTIQSEHSACTVATVGDSPRSWFRRVELLEYSATEAVSRTAGFKLLTMTVRVSRQRFVFADC